MGSVPWSRISESTGCEEVLGTSPASRWFLKMRNNFIRGNDSRSAGETYDKLEAIPVVCGWSQIPLNTKSHYVVICVCLLRMGRMLKTRQERIQIICLSTTSPKIPQPNRQIHYLYPSPSSEPKQVQYPPPCGLHSHHHPILSPRRSWGLAVSRHEIRLGWMCCQSCIFARGAVHKMNSKRWKMSGWVEWFA